MGRARLRPSASCSGWPGRGGGTRQAVPDANDLARGHQPRLDLPPRHVVVDGDHHVGDDPRCAREEPLHEPSRAARSRSRARRVIVDDDPACAGAAQGRVGARPGGLIGEIDDVDPALANEGGRGRDRRRRLQGRVEDHRRGRRTIEGAGRGVDARVGDEGLDTERRQASRRLGVEALDEIPGVAGVRGIVADAEQPQRGGDWRQDGREYTIEPGRGCCRVPQVCSRDAGLRPSVRPARLARAIARRRPRRFATGVLDGVLAAIAGWYAINHTPIADYLVAPLIHADTQGRGDAIVVLGAGTSGRCELNIYAIQRVRLAARLWQEGRAPRVLITGGVGWGTSCAVASAMADFAMQLGVPRGALILETSSQSTHENAERAAPLLRAAGAQRVDDRHRSPAHAAGRGGLRARGLHRRARVGAGLRHASRQHGDADGGARARRWRSRTTAGTGGWPTGLPPPRRAASRPVEERPQR